MANVIIGEKVVNKMKETGVIVSVEGSHVIVSFPHREAKFMVTAFEDGYLRYVDTALQRAVDADVALAKQAKEQELAAKNRAREKAQSDRRLIQAMAHKSQFKVAVVSASIRLDAAPITFQAVRKQDQDVIQAVFAECDKDTPALFAQFDPKMEYSRMGTVSYSISKYCVGFLSQHLGTYVFRVFSRNDTYKNNPTDGLTIMHSDTTEIMRVLRVNDCDYYFTKHVYHVGGFFANSQSYNNWHVSDVNSTFLLNEVIRHCDCGYLNEYIAASNVEGLSYVRLLFPAFFNSKAEVVFKNRAFASADRIQDPVGYLEAFSSKHVDYASKHDALNTLPVIQRYGLIDPPILRELEQMMRQRRDGRSVYDVLKGNLARLELDCPDLDKRLLGFLKKVHPLNRGVYADYINELLYQPNVTLRDFFDKDYVERHLVTLREKRVNVSAQEQEQYRSVAEELSWIDRQEEGRFVILPKTVTDFLYEGDAQHNCVYTNRYFYKVIRRYSIIVFLREDKQQPFVTIEYEYGTFEVLQALGKYNRPIDSALYRYVVALGKRLKYEMLSQQ